MHKICIWTPTNTHHQSDFHDAIVRDGRIDLQVRYFTKISKERLSLGWEDKKSEKVFEQEVLTLEEAIASLDDFQKRIHIIAGNGYPFTKELIKYCIDNNMKWINWTERSGIRLFYLLGQNSFLFKLVYPIYQKFYNTKFAKQIEKYSLGTFVYGLKAEENYIQRGVSPDKIKHLYYALKPLVHTNTIPHEVKNNKFKYNFIYVGSLSKLKGIDVLLKGYAKLKTEEWGLILVGDDTSNRKYHQLTKKLNIEEKVIFTGSIDFNKVNEYMSYADVFILPSRYDGWGAVLNEAASLGLPIISTDECGAAYHLIEDNKNGFMVKAANIKDLNRALSYFVNNPKQLASFGTNSIELYKEYTTDKNTQRLIQALDEWNT